ncbi:MAG TPA: aminodeoxychorismate synthase component I [Gemmatales bacterium]|nr:aminodeoxychorismate synthase component I [Gemmatales bacterium]
MNQHGPVLVTPLPPGLEPTAAFARLRHLPHVVWFDSALRHPTLGRYSFLAADPLQWHSWPTASPAAWDAAADLIRSVPRLSAAELGPAADALPPFVGGVAGLFSYDLHRGLERIPPPQLDEFLNPVLALGVYDWTLAWDHKERRGWLISTGWRPGTGLDADWARERATHVQDWLSGSGPESKGEAQIDEPIVPPALPRIHAEVAPGVYSNFTAAEYTAAVQKTIDYIHAGDCFQVNLAQRLLAPAQPATDLYERLRQQNPGTFAGYFDLGAFQVLSSSPERFLKVTPGGAVETRPIKGTRPRAADPTADETIIQALRQSPKDRAENVMIVDLLRNDLGRVCAYGSVRVADLCRVESYAAVHHLVSVVTGQLAPGALPHDLLRACFPGGSVTGAPKVRAMEIIAELEPTARGPYCGSLAYFSFTGALDANILIRTLTRGRGWLQFPVGGGIVADSTPQAEYAETMDKAAGLLRALTP